MSDTVPIPTASIAEIVRAQRAAEVELEHLRAEFELREVEINTRIAECQQRRDLLILGLDAGRLQRALCVLELKGECNSEFRRAAVDRAIRDIAAGGELLRRSYIGLRDYAHWRDLECDLPYAYGPKHGHVVFRIGLRNRGQHPISPQQIEDAVYLLEWFRVGRVDANGKAVGP